MALSTRILTSFAVETGGMSATRANKGKIAGGGVSREKGTGAEKRVLRNAYDGTKEPGECQ